MIRLNVNRFSDFVQSSIHFLLLIWGCVSGAGAYARIPRLLSPQPPPPASTAEHRGNPRPVRDIISPACPRFSSGGTSPKTPHIGGIFARCPNWLISMWGSSGSMLSPSHLAELLTLCLKARQPLEKAHFHHFYLQVVTSRDVDEWMK